MEKASNTSVKKRPLVGTWEESNSYQIHTSQKGYMKECSKVMEQRKKEIRRRYKGVSIKGGFIQRIYTKHVLVYLWES